MSLLCAMPPKEESTLSVGTVARHVLTDVVAATLAAAAAAPFVASVDRAIAESASGKAPLWKSFSHSLRTLGSTPLTFIRQPAFFYLWMCGTGTYGIANLTTTFEDLKGAQMPVEKAATIFGVNTSLMLWKDSNFAKLFGTKPPEAVPYPALGAWFARDFISMAVIFVAPPIVAKKVSESTGTPVRKAEVLTQLTMPMILQPFVSPFHLYGYVKYNSPHASWSEQMQVMRREIWGTVVMRCIRCVAPYCVGAVANRSLRRTLKEVA